MNNAMQPYQIIGTVDDEQFNKSLRARFDCYYTNFYVFVEGVKTFLTQQRRFPNSSNFFIGYDEDEIEELHGTFISSKGKYTHRTDYPDPFALLETMKDEGYKFTDMLSITELEGGFELMGNLLQISQVFSYRFFCRETLNKWIKLARPIDPAQDYSVTPDKLIFP